jgi:hypothetical protein
MKLTTRIGQSRWFYVGMPLLALAGSLVSLFMLVMAGVGAHYHPIPPSQWITTYAGISFGLGMASILALLLMAIAKYGFASPRRASFVLMALLGWVGWSVYLLATAPPEDAAYHRVFDGQRYSMPWNRLPGDLTASGNSTQRWEEVSRIGFTYCAKPFDVDAGNNIRCDVGTFLAGQRGVTAYPLHNQQDDPEGLQLLAHLQRLQQGSGNAAAPSLAGGSSTSASGSSTSSGGPAPSWGHIRGTQIADIAGMLAFESSGLPSQRAIYLFSRDAPDAQRFHRAVCRPGIRNGQVVDPALMCQHYIRAGERAWTFALPISETAQARARLAQLQRQLVRFRSQSAVAPERRPRQSSNP